MTTDSCWNLGARKRWQITAHLKTSTALHIGSSESVYRDDILINRNGEEKFDFVEINSVVRGKDDLPIIPGSTLKGKLRQWLVEREVDPALLKSVFGKESSRDGDQGCGGLAEFHDAQIAERLTGKQPHYPYWREDCQTWIMASTAIDRHTGSALHQHLRYTEVVPPGVAFKVLISGVMEDNEANSEVDILLAALQGCRAEASGICLGSGEADGMGRMQLCGKIEARYLDNSAICDWLNSIGEGEGDFSAAMAMADNATWTRKLEEQEIRKRVRKLAGRFAEPAAHDIPLDVRFQFDGPFLVSHPVNKEGNDPKQPEPDLIPLRDSHGNPLLPASSIRGALRSQAERIVRTLGGHCCDTEKLCKPVHKQEDVAERCIVCQVFGAAGWKTGVLIQDFQWMQELEGPKEQKIRETRYSGSVSKQQDFVAIDRFHGGGKDRAKFAVQHSESPCFQGRITVSGRVNESGKGLFALVLRDLREGDITFGFGASKGYGQVEPSSVRITPHEQLDAHIAALRKSVAAQPGEYPCVDVSEPKLHDDLGSRGDPMCSSCSTGQTRRSAPTVLDRNPVKPDQDTFHNPYHFIPVKPPLTNSWLPRESLSADKLKKSSPYHSHALYRQETEDGAGNKKSLYHGRIICRLITETPLFIGAEREKTEEQDPVKAKKVENYRLDERLAIPATSLRGMISSLAEAASNSALRVLDDGMLSFRKEAKDALREIGMLLKEGEKLFILPLSSAVQAYKLKHAYKEGNKDKGMKQFLEDKQSWSPQHNRVYYLPKKYGHGEVPDTAYAEGKTPGILRILGKGKDADRSEELQNKLHELFIKIPTRYVDTERNRFDYQQYIADQQNNLLPVPEQVHKRYQSLADQRSRSQKSDRELKEDTDCTSTRWLPFHLKGQERERDATDRFCTLPLRHGDLVWYATEKDSGRVSEIAFSSIWRGRVEDGSHNASKVDSFFPKDLLPFNPERQHISPAELLFGFVEDLEKEQEESSGRDKGQQQALAFAGKVRVSAGILPKDAPADSELLESKRITLKALSTPKPPSPALYFTRPKDPGSTQAISKAELSADSHQAMGRKHYLHALRRKDDTAAVQQLDKQGHPADSGIHSYPWKSLHPKDRPEMKVRVKPIVTGTSFYFHLDFSNLTEWELGLLCFALRPNNPFRHKLGMGKPIGLGTVRIDLAGLHFINRKKRYAEDSPEDARWNQGGWTDPDLRQELEQAGYDVPEQGEAPAPEQCRQRFLQTIDPDIYRALDLLGNPQHVRKPVHYPQVKADAHGDESNIDIENENFKWFVDNDKDHHECLSPLDENSDCLPLLTRKKEVER
uniref:TIGR03986 family type III CRISPR-associated RAMP protein n=1 Tax=Candidatus Electrothrix sp. TaxID=2170559 RepID=UPI004055A0E3